MGPLLNMVTWYKKHLAGWHIIHWGKKTKRKSYIIQKASFVSFQGPIALFAFQQGGFGTI